MLENISKVLVVDNEQREIDKINRALRELNIPAYTILYSQANPPAEPFSGIRLVFFDIKLQDGNDVTKQTITSFENALRACIHAENGPFVLIFWSSHTDKVEDIKAHIEERAEDSIPKPLLVDCIDKVTTGDPEDLKREITRVFDNDIIEILFDYETKISKAVGKSLDTIFNVVSNGEDTWGNSDRFNDNFDLVFSNIAFQTLGFDNARSYPLNAIRDGLNPILINEIGKMQLSPKWNDKLQKLLGCDGKSKFNYIDSLTLGRLNSIYHYDFNGEHGVKNDRGVVVCLGDLSEDETISYFGASQKEILHSFLPFDSRKARKAERRQIKDSASLVLLEVSAACDYAQANPRNYVYILGVLVPEFDSDLLTTQASSITRLPTFFFNQKCHYLFFNSRYVVSFPDVNSKLLGDILFRLKNELLNKVITDHTNYLSRLGIIQF
ncbi:hypothetical protein [uncultured Sunxiuqinia sp.]|uniref:hypothetical protein n=1 Tax=uncultured Sunxiuqinia sp. TaxID=1573825 RepID=UPI0026096305|nr:hypothetical protein [uncultured Sunxiuqinia sp.]